MQKDNSIRIIAISPHIGNIEIQQSRQSIEVSMLTVSYHFLRML
jgi:hypothetical protein